jgi:hypothetical protein
MNLGNGEFVVFRSDDGVEILTKEQFESNMNDPVFQEMAEIVGEADFIVDAMVMKTEAETLTTMSAFIRKKELDYEM